MGRFTKGRFVHRQVILRYRLRSSSRAIGRAFGKPCTPYCRRRARARTPSAEEVRSGTDTGSQRQT
eukprot:6390698-Pyramimonas_sp.AAC.1